MTNSPQNSTQRTRRRVIGVAAGTVAAAGIVTAVVWGGVAAGSPEPATRPAAVVSFEDNPQAGGRTTAAVVPGDRRAGTGIEPGDDRDARAQVTDGRAPQSTTYAPPTSTTHPETSRNHVEPGDDHGRHVEPGDDHGRHLEPGDDHGRHNEPGDDHGGDSGHGGPGRH